MPPLCNSSTGSELCRNSTMQVEDTTVSLDPDLNFNDTSLAGTTTTLSTLPSFADTRSNGTGTGSSSAKYLTVWVPYLSLICLMAVCLALSFSFFQHWKRVNKRRRNAQDYVELDIDLRRKRLFGMMRAPFHDHHDDPGGGGTCRSLDYLGGDSKFSSKNKSRGSNYYDYHPPLGKNLSSQGFGGFNRYECATPSPTPETGFGYRKYDAYRCHNDGENSWESEMGSRNHLHQQNNQHHQQHQQHQQHQHHCVISCQACWGEFKMELRHLIAQGQGEIQNNGEQTSSSQSHYSQKDSNIDSGGKRKSKNVSKPVKNLGLMKNTTTAGSNSILDNKWDSIEKDVEVNEESDYSVNGETKPGRTNRKFHSGIPSNANKTDDNHHGLHRQRQITLLDSQTHSDPGTSLPVLQHVHHHNSVNNITSGHPARRVESELIIQSPVPSPPYQLQDFDYHRSDNDLKHSSLPHSYKMRDLDEATTPESRIVSFSNPTYKDAASSSRDEAATTQALANNGGVINYGFQSESTSPFSHPNSMPTSGDTNLTRDSNNSLKMSSSENGNSSLSPFKNANKNTTGKKRKSFLKTHHKKNPDGGNFLAQTNGIGGNDSHHIHHDVISSPAHQPSSGSHNQRLDLSVINLGNDGFSQMPSSGNLFSAHISYANNDIDV